MSFIWTLSWSGLGENLVSNIEIQMCTNSPFSVLFVQHSLLPNNFNCLDYYNFRIYHYFLMILLVTKTGRKKLKSKTTYISFVQRAKEAKGQNNLSGGKFSHKFPFKMLNLITDGHNFSFSGFFQTASFLRQHPLPFDLWDNYLWSFLCVGTFALSFFFDKFEYIIHCHNLCFPVLSQERSPDIYTA